MIIKGGNYLDANFKIAESDIAVENGKIAAIGSSFGVQERDCEVLDAHGCTVIPGLIDIHTHGCGGIDVMTATPDDFVRLSELYAKNGVTSFMATTVSSARESLLRAVDSVRTAVESKPLSARIVGIHVEGPYINPKFRGCHKPEYLTPPSIEEYESLKKQAGDALKLRYTVAPELEGGLDFIRHVCGDGGYVTLGHCDSDYETAMQAVDCGANSFTHLYNAMKGLHHRQAGTAGAGLLSDAYAELIVDGIHICPEMIRLAYRMKSLDKVLLITDSMCAAGCADGEYEFGGERIHVINGAARTADDTLAGSTLFLKNGVKNLMKFAGASLGQAVQCATLNPARAVGLDRVCGSIEVGKRADLVLLDDTLNVVCTVSGGKVVYRA